MTTQPESLMYWLKLTAAGTIPRASDWRDPDYSGDKPPIDWTVGTVMTLIRLVMLVTFPVSVPGVALFWFYVDRKTLARIADWLYSDTGRKGESNE